MPARLKFDFTQMVKVEEAIDVTEAPVAEDTSNQPAQTEQSKGTDTVVNKKTDVVVTGDVNTILPKIALMLSTLVFAFCNIRKKGTSEDEGTC